MPYRADLLPRRSPALLTDTPEARQCETQLGVSTCRNFDGDLLGCHKRFRRREIGTREPLGFAPITKQNTYAYSIRQCAQQCFAGVQAAARLVELAAARGEYSSVAEDLSLQLTKFEFAGAFGRQPSPMSLSSRSEGPAKRDSFRIPERRTAE